MTRPIGTVAPISTNTSIAPVLISPLAASTYGTYTTPLAGNSSIVSSQNYGPISNINGGIPRRSFTATGGYPSQYPQQFATSQVVGVPQPPIVVSQPAPVQRYSVPVAQQVFTQQPVIAQQMRVSQPVITQPVQQFVQPV